MDYKGGLPSNWHICTYVYVHICTYSMYMKFTSFLLRPASQPANECAGNLTIKIICIFCFPMTKKDISNIYPKRPNCSLVSLAYVAGLELHKCHDLSCPGHILNFTLISYLFRGLGAPSKNFHRL